MKNFLKILDQIFFWKMVMVVDNTNILEDTFIQFIFSNSI